MSRGKLRLACLFGVAAVLLAFCVALRMSGPVAVTGHTPQQRVEAVNRLTGEHPAGAAAAIADAARNDPDAAVRRAAVLSLATFRRSEDRAIVEQAMQDPDSSVRAAAVASLGSYGADTVPRLAALAQDPDPQVRAGVVAGLRETGRGPGLTRLLQMMARQGDPEVQIQALQAIESISNVYYRNVPDPRDAAAWAHMVVRVRNNAWVNEALAAEQARGVQP